MLLKLWLKRVDQRGYISKKELSITPPMCAACTKGKATQALFPASKSGHADKVLGLVHSDLWGPAPVQTITGTHYVITFKDDTKEWKQMLKDRGICHETTSPDTPKQNGDAKHQNWSIFDRVRTVLIDAGLPLSMFAEAVNYIVYTKNCNSTSTLNQNHRLLHVNPLLTISNPLVKVTPHSSKRQNITWFHSLLVNQMLVQTWMLALIAQMQTLALIVQMQMLLLIVQTRMSALIVQTWTLALT
jgi:hypothetical protein